MISEGILKTLSKQGIMLRAVREWRVRDAIAPKLSHDAVGGETRLIVASNGSAGCYGGPVAGEMPYSYPITQRIKE